MHPLDGPRLKVERAISQIRGLRLRQEALWKDRNHQIVRAELNPKTGYYVYRAQGQFTLSLDWGVIIGEIAHNLRSALDGTVYQLAIHDQRAKGKRPSAEALRHTEFPVFLVGRTKRRQRPKPGRSGMPPLIPHFEREGRKKIKLLSSKHQRMIERLQPYHRRSEDGAKGRGHPLYWLQEINTADKHRVIPIVGYRADGLTWGTWEGELAEADPFKDVIFTKRPHVLKNGAKVGFEAAPHVVVNPRVIALVAFAEGSVGVKNRWVVGTLQKAADTVGQIVQAFALDFG
jgi:hypothetical protein